MPNAVTPRVTAHLEALYQADTSSEHADSATGPIYARDIRNALRQYGYGISILAIVAAVSFAAATALTARCKQ